MTDILSISKREEPTSVVLVRPDHFRIVDVKNPYMSGSEIDRDLAVRQWEALHKIYIGLRDEGLLKEVHVVEGAEGLEDMVFCANQSLPFKGPDGAKKVVLSNMRYASRQKEVPYFKEFYRANNYEVSDIPDGLLLEGMGDCIFHPFRKLLWMGHGYRTSLDTAAHLERILEMKVIPLKLVSEYFYHLDTSFLPIDEYKVAVCTEAFDQASIGRLRKVFCEVVEIPLKMAVDTFCLNAHCIYHRETPVAVVPAGDHLVTQVLEASGYRIIEADTSEFIKSGGSVYCMKMMIY